MGRSVREKKKEKGINKLSKKRSFPRNLARFFFIRQESVLCILSVLFGEVRVYQGTENSR
jgi:hypothetical protein